MNRTSGPATSSASKQSFSRHCTFLGGSEIVHVAVTAYPTLDWAAQQIVESCAWDRWPPRFLIHDRDSRYRVRFDCRVRRLGIQQLRTPFRAPGANAIAERRAKSARSECLDYLLIFNETHLRRAMSAYNCWRPHRSLGQRAPCDSGVTRVPPRETNCNIIAEPVLGGMHHIYKHAA